MKLEDFVGPYLLDAVDFDKMKNEQDYYPGNQEMINVMYIRLNFRVYAIIEDPNDGYRSSMKEVLIVDRVMKNVFPAVVVDVKRLNEYKRWEDDSFPEAMHIIQLVEKRSGKVVVEFGTGNVDDYYPYYVAKFDPKVLGEVEVNKPQ